MLIHYIAKAKGRRYSADVSTVLTLNCSFIDEATDLAACYEKKTCNYAGFFCFAAFITRPF